MPANTASRAITKEWLTAMELLRLTARGELLWNTQSIDLIALVIKTQMSSLHEQPLTAIAATMLPPLGNGPTNQELVSQLRGFSDLVNQAALRIESLAIRLDLGGADHD